jgi:hypothetical protein
MKWIITNDKSLYAGSEQVRVGWGTLRDEARDTIDTLPVPERRAYACEYANQEHLTHEFALFDSEGRMVYGGRCENPLMTSDCWTPMLRMGCWDMKARPVGECKWSNLR